MPAKRKSYAEKLLDPKWQKKRLEVLNASEWTCKFCSSKEKTLHVHHLRYLKGKNPWDYPNDDLQCLCDTCHSAAEEARDDLLMTLTDKHIAPALTAFGLMMQSSVPTTSLMEVMEPLRFIITISKSEASYKNIKFLREYICEVTEALFKFLAEYRERVAAEESKHATPEEMDEFFGSLKTLFSPEER